MSTRSSPVIILSTMTYLHKSILRWKFCNKRFFFLPYNIIKRNIINGLDASSYFIYLCFVMPDIGTDKCTVYFLFLDISVVLVTKSAGATSPCWYHLRWMSGKSQGIPFRRTHWNSFWPSWEGTNFGCMLHWMLLMKI